MTAPGQPHAAAPANPMPQPQARPMPQPQASPMPQKPLVFLCFLCDRSAAAARRQPGRERHLGPSGRPTQQEPFARALGKNTYFIFARDFERFCANWCPVRLLRLLAGQLGVRSNFGPRCWDQNLGPDLGPGPGPYFSRERRAKGSCCVGLPLGPSCLSREAAAGLPPGCRRVAVV